MALRYGCVYVATNTANGQQYVGQTIQSLSARVTAHVSHAKAPIFKFHQAIHDFGRAVFNFAEVFIAFDKTALDDVEREFISALNPAYNATKGGAGTPGRLTTAETREKRSRDAKLRWSDPEWRAITVASIREAAKTDAAKQRGHAVQKYNGGALRWAGHVKKPKPEPCDRSAQIKAIWVAHRDKLMAGLHAANLRPEVIERRRLAMRNRPPMARETVDRIARAKWKPVYCPELEITFLSRNAAAEFLGVLRTSVTNAIKQKGKVKREFSLLEVA